MKYQARMRIELVRIAFKDTYTIGKLYVDDTYFCDVLEDVDRGLDSSMTESEILKKKVKGETAIPTGHYVINITYSPKYKQKKKGKVLILPFPCYVNRYFLLTFHHFEQPLVRVT